MATATSSDGKLSPSLLADPETYCTVDSCPLSLAYVLYRPTLVGNALYVAFFGLYLVGQLFLGVRHRTWGFLVGMVAGIVLEVIGYIGRIQMHYNPFLRGPFLMYLCCLTIGPAFLSASIYLTFARIIPIYSSTLSRFKPRTYTFLFITFDVIAILLQAAGGAIASLAGDDKTTRLGINIMVAGVSWQVFSLGLFAILCSEFAWRVGKARDEDLTCRVEFVQLRRTERFRIFLCVWMMAMSAIFARSVYRCVELRDGFKGGLANDEMLFMILEGAMIVLAVGLLTVWHPGLAFGECWADARWRVRGEKKKSGRWTVGKGRGEKTGAWQRSRVPPTRPQRP